MITPKYIYTLIDQDPEQSVIDDSGKYDFTRYSQHEAETIRDVLTNVRVKYPLEYRSLGLVNESEAVKYKARYLLFEMVIQKYNESKSAVDQLAVAFAYQTKGAHFRKEAIDCFEKAISLVADSVLQSFIYLAPQILYNKFSSLCEKEHEWDKAIKYLQLAKTHCDYDTPFYDAHIKELKEKKTQNKPLRKRKRSPDDERLEASISYAASVFLARSGL